MIRTILVPLDGSSLSEQGAYAACCLARQTHSELLLLTAVPCSPHGGAEARAGERAALADARGFLRYQQQVLAGQGITSRTLILPGDPARAILFAAEREGAELISMATHGRSGLPRALLGSVAAAVIRGSRVPILLSRRHHWPIQQQAGAFRPILVPLDGTSFAEAALSYVEAEGLGLGGEVLLARVVEQADMGPVPALAPGEKIIELYETTGQETERRRAEADQYLGVLVTGRAGNPPYRQVVAVGDAAKVITTTAQEEHIDLVVLATHDRHGVDRLLHGSVARSLIQHAGVPVLLLHGAAEALEKPAGYVSLPPSGDPPDVPRCSSC